METHFKRFKQETAQFSYGGGCFGRVCPTKCWQEDWIPSRKSSLNNEFMSSKVWQNLKTLWDRKVIMHDKCFSFDTLIAKQTELAKHRGIFQSSHVFDFTQQLLAGQLSSVSQQKSIRFDFLFNEQLSVSLSKVVYICSLTTVSSTWVRGLQRQISVWAQPSTNNCCLWFITADRTLWQRKLQLKFKVWEKQV